MATANPNSVGCKCSTGSGCKTSRCDCVCQDVPCSSNCSCGKDCTRRGCNCSAKSGCKTSRCDCVCQDVSCSSNCSCGKDCTRRNNGRAVETNERGGKGGACKGRTIKEEGATAAAGGDTDRGGGSKKRSIYTRVQGDASMDLGTVLTTIGHLVRDDAISKRKEEVVQCHKAHSYYLRPRKPPSGDHVDEVDHTFECQMLAHAIFQTPTYHPVLTQMDISTTSHNLKKQPFVVQGALEPLKSIQNCVDDPTLFNLRMMNKSLNITKGAVIKRWLDDRVKHSGAHLQEADLRNAYHKSASVQNGIIDIDEADRLARVLAKDLVIAEEAYVDRLGQAEEKVGVSSARVTDKRVQKDRLVELKETISGLQEEHRD